MNVHEHIIAEAVVNLKDALARLPGAELRPVTHARLGDYQPDALLELSHEGHCYLIIVEAKSQATTSGIARVAAYAQVVDRPAEDATDLVPVIAAPHLGPRLAEFCRKLGVGYVDLRGNLHLSVGPIYIDIEGRKGQAEPRPLKSVFAPKSSRVVRALLFEPNRQWREAELVRITDTSRPLVNRVIRLLVEEELCERSEGRIRVIDAAAILDLWAEHYRYRRVRWQPCHIVMEDLPDAARVLTHRASELGHRVAFTGALAGALLAPYATAHAIQVYLSPGGEDLLRELRATPVETGGNVLVNMPPWDEGVFYGAVRNEGIILVSSVQVYLDLVRMGSRAEEGAGILRDRVIGF